MAYSFDIYTQVARALRSGAALGGLKPKHLIAAGESQSAFALVTYYNGVQPLTHAFDGFFVHSRGASGLPLVGPGQSADLAGSIGRSASIFRTDQSAPIMDVQSETDITSILDSYAARQPDNDRLRVWEVVGTSHADAHLLGSGAKYVQCGVPINDGPMYLVAQAAYHDLTTWLDTGKAPPHAARIEVAPGTSPQIVRNSDGIALGRSPHPAGRCPGRRVVGRARAEPVDHLLAARLEQAAPGFTARAPLPLACRLSPAVRGGCTEGDQGRVRPRRGSCRARILCRALSDSGMRPSRGWGEPQGGGPRSVPMLGPGTAGQSVRR